MQQCSVNISVIFRIFQTGPLTTKPTANIQGTTALQGTLVKGHTGASIVVKTSGNVAGHFATINKRMTAHSGSPAANLATMVSVYFFVDLKFFSVSNVFKYTPCQSYNLLYTGLIICNAGGGGGIGVFISALLFHTLDNMTLLCLKLNCE